VIEERALTRKCGPTKNFDVEKDTINRWAVGTCDDGDVSSCDEIKPVCETFEWSVLRNSGNGGRRG